MTEPSSGTEILRSPTETKSTAFTREERQALGLEGLLPHRVTSLDEQAARALENMRRKSCDIEKYIFLSALQDRNETLFYHLICNEMDEIMPLIYTPTVGQACKEFAHIFRRPRGLYITPDHKGRISDVLANWPSHDVNTIVVTDGQRILGLGDLGANGMGIPIGKLALYTACAGVEPGKCLPIMFDVGTNNEELRNDPMYLGYPGERKTGDEYLELFDELIDALQERYPECLVQFEDFLTPNAYAILDRFTDKILCFNDDIQGTAAVTLAGLYSAASAKGMDFKDMRVMFLGAGSAATGIGDLVVAALERAGLSREQAYAQIQFVDMDGLLVRGRAGLMSHNEAYAVDSEPLEFEPALKAFKPHALIGATGAPGVFSESVVKQMAQFNEQPIVFALSNPTSKAECTAEDAYKWTDGKALFASGSPFDPVTWKGRTLKPGQGNNAYIFPGIGLGALAGNLTRLPQDLFLTAASSLASSVDKRHFETGTLYPPLKDIRTVSRQIAIDVALAGVQAGLSRGGANYTAEEVAERVDQMMYVPAY